LCGLYQDKMEREISPLFLIKHQVFVKNTITLL
jgi:hypothetical protein